MKKDYELRRDGMNLLRNQLGLVESERFLTPMPRDPFDYTHWRESQWTETSVTELAEQFRLLRSKPGNAKK